MLLFRVYLEPTVGFEPTPTEQAGYFGLTRSQAIELGTQAKTFTANALSQPFTIQTRWRSVFGARYYAIVVTADGHDLNELLVSNGLARIYGTRTPLPDGRDSREYLAHLHILENAAKAAKRGGVGCRAAVKYWEIIADDLSKAGWSLGWVAAIDSAVLLKRKARASLSSDRPRSFKSVNVVRPPALPLLDCIKESDRFLVPAR